MTTDKKIFYLLLVYLGILLCPYIGAWILYDGKFPADFFAFPPLVAGPKAPFNRVVFIIVSIIFLATALLYFFPSVYGFKKVTVTPKTFPKVSLPIWFWIGLVMFAVTLTVLWGKFNEPKWLINWAVLPLFWGFTLMLDGWVYIRKGGSSIIRNSLQKLIGIGVASISGWMIFEYLNFFVDENWLYPMGGLIPPAEFMLYAMIGSSGLLPMAFEWYSLLLTFEKFKYKYSQGPKITFPSWLQTLCMILCFAGLFAISFFPNDLSGLLWIAPLVVISVALCKLDIWTPFRSVRDGNWGPLLIMALTYFIQGVLCECWNYFSAYHVNGQPITVNPDYWTYSIPFVNVLHVFEMPLLGLLGYLPFGVYCSVWWISFAFLINVPTDYHKTEHHSI